LSVYGLPLIAEPMYWVYIVASRSGTLYTGVTNDLERRVGEHRAGTIPGFASKYRCTRLVFAEEFASIHDAIAAEKKIKAWRRSKKVWWIERHNASWADLAAELDAPTE
jgi:putative endonuclease